MSDSDNNRRAFERFDSDMAIWFRLAEKKDADFVLVEICNISAGGLLFKLDQPPPMDAVIEVRFELPQNNDLVEATAEIKRVEKESDDTYLIGIRFTKVKNYTIKVLMAYLEALFT